MDNFEALVDSISNEDAATRVVSKRKVILEAINSYIAGPEGQCASVLWLVDWNENQDEATCTLWSHASQNWPNYPAEIQFMSIVTSAKLRPDSAEFTSLSKKLEKVGKGLMLLPNAEGAVAKKIDQSLIKLCQRGEGGELERLVGFIQVFANEESLSYLAGAKKRIVAKLLSNRIVFGRRQRVHDAIQHLQNSICDGMTEIEIIKCAVDTLRKYISSSDCCFYTYQAADGPLRHEVKGKTSAKHSALTPVVQNYLQANVNWANRATVRRYHNCLSREPSNPLRNFIGTSVDENEQPPIDLMLISIPVGTLSEAPFVTIKMAVQPENNFIGGRFSTTDEVIASSLADYLRHLLPGVITQCRAKLIAEKLDSIESPELLSNRHDFRSFWPFADLITRVLPAIKSAWAVREHTDKATNKKVSNWIDQSKKSAVHPYPVPNDNAAHIVPLSNGGNLHWEPVLAAADETYWLCWKTERNILSEHDQIAVKLISSEMRLRAIGKLDVHELLQQTNELRHAIRSSMTGVTGHAEAISASYNNAKNMSADERDRFLYEQGFFRKSIERLQYSAEKSRMFFTDVRLLKSKLSVDDLRLYAHDPFGIVKDIVGFMRPEANRREIVINMVNKMAPNAPLPVFDQDFLHVAISNLIDNAIKYARRGTNVNCEVGMLGDRWYFSVEDTGRFIPASVRDDIFTGERQQTFLGETGQPGTGLGLPAVRRIIRVHDPIHGREEISSEKIEGHDPNAPTALTRFTILMRRNLKISDIDVNAI